MEFDLPLPKQVLTEAPQATNSWINLNQRYKIHAKINPLRGTDISYLRNGSVFLHLCGIGVVDTVKNYHVHHENKDISACMTLELIADRCFPRLFLLYERYKFFSCKQNIGECICKYLARLLYLFECCEFQGYMEMYIVRRIVRGTTNKALQKKLSKKKYSKDLETVLKMCGNFTTCMDASCCVDFTTYAKEILGKTVDLPTPTTSVSDSLNVLSPPKTTEDSCRTQVVETTSLKTIVHEQEAAADSPRAAQKNFWEFENLVRNKAADAMSTANDLVTLGSLPSFFPDHPVTSSTLGTSLDVPVTPLTTDPDLSNAAPVVKIEYPCEDSNTESSALLNEDKALWGETGIGGGGGYDSDDSCDDVPVTMCVPVGDGGDENSESQIDTLDREEEDIKPEREESIGKETVDESGDSVAQNKMSNLTAYNYVNDAADAAATVDNKDEEKEKVDEAGKPEEEEDDDCILIPTKPPSPITIHENDDSEDSIKIPESSWLSKKILEPALSLPQQTPIPKTGGSFFDMYSAWRTSDKDRPTSEQNHEAVVAPIVSSTISTLQKDTTNDSFNTSTPIERSGKRSASWRGNRKRHKETVMQTSLSSCDNEKDDSERDNSENSGASSEKTVTPRTKRIPSVEEENKQTEESQARLGSLRKRSASGYVESKTTWLSHGHKESDTANLDDSSADENMESSRKKKKKGCGEDERTKVPETREIWTMEGAKKVSCLSIAMLKNS